MYVKYVCICLYICVCVVYGNVCKYASADLLEPLLGLSV